MQRQRPQKPLLKQSNEKQKKKPLQCVKLVKRTVLRQWSKLVYNYNVKRKLKPADRLALQKSLPLFASPSSLHLLLLQLVLPMEMFGDGPLLQIAFRLHPLVPVYLLLLVRKVLAPLLHRTNTDPVRCQGQPPEAGGQESKRKLQRLLSQGPELPDLHHPHLPPL